MDDDHDSRIETRSIHAGQEPDSETGALMTPIHANSTYKQDAPGDHRGYEYSRTGNPTRTDLEENLASLENAEYGRAFASGMAAINTVLNLLEAGDHVVTGNDVYGGTHRIFTQVYEDYDLEFSFVDMTDLDEIEAAFREETALLWLETPTNPLMSIVDIEGAAEIAHDHDALCAIDNTFATPYLQRPLDLGADIVSHSLTKYLGGHSDVVGGALLTNDGALDERLGFYQNSVGATPGPFESFLVLRGTKTLPVRMDRHCENARAIAEWLADHPDVERVYYPGLESHPGHEIAAEQMDDFGGMLSFELDASLEQASEVVSNTEIFTLAESLGGVESLIEQPAPMTHAAIPREERLAAGLSDSLIRVSVGIEHVDDLIADLEQAIDAALA
ncbi:Cys/Met metabolism pyridoxal-phosphate-dependent protein [Natrinema pellirubrum DSM 15624]|uniref:Cys/Met metabolism pyridoxal-phosphate-dependent protein n=1 Tax=Natrinema pellirubrum (strain DSM 15624 / CIP 106293 / JCM 10476 / NCIMB 786 / 157) TaxID=797303 RepID=L0JKG4_NATP1|nr:cystathionine gamma-synthase [Natrinema pellirubrum]AGB31318.1 cystathionine beta-lyase/cystathionine gamma-synthase [Natrinema pellirubrum DSM 15624]ELY81747.1 Cys/Met metabolism pyridoxal-phosphate-dependent protein [Natrinema pellirubrum DSM 15624]